MVSKASILSNSEARGDGRGLASSVQRTVLLLTAAAGSHTKCLLNFWPLLSTWFRLWFWMLQSSVGSPTPTVITDMRVWTFRCWVMTGASIPVVAGLSASRKDRSCMTLWGALLSISGTWTHTKWCEIYGSEVIKASKVTEAKVPLIGCLESDGYIQINDSRVEREGDRGKDVGTYNIEPFQTLTIRIPCSIV